MESITVIITVTQLSYHTTASRESLGLTIHRYKSTYMRSVGTEPIMRRYVGTRTVPPWCADPAEASVLGRSSFPRKKKKDDSHTDRGVVS
jgi:hypothetical protein